MKIKQIRKFSQTQIKIAKTRFIWIQAKYYKLSWKDLRQRLTKLIIINCKFNIHYLKIINFKDKIYLIVKTKIVKIGTKLIKLSILTILNKFINNNS